MKHLLALIFACVTLLSTSACAADAPVAPTKPHERMTAVRIVTAGGKCSGTTIAPHVIISAAHCFRTATNLIMVNDKVGMISRILQDGNDHAIVVVSEDITFTTFAPIGPPVDEGDLIHYWGNPYLFDMMLRRGYVSGFSGVNTVFDVNGYQGDSGAGIFNAKGQLIAILSYLQGEGPFVLIGSYPINFTSTQLASVGLAPTPYLSTGITAVVNLVYE